MVMFVRCLVLSDNINKNKAIIHQKKQKTIVILSLFNVFYFRNFFQKKIIHRINA